MQFNLDISKITDTIEVEGFDVINVFFKNHGVDKWSTFVHAITGIDDMTLSIKVHNNCIIIDRRISPKNKNNMVHICYFNNYKSFRDIVNWERLEFEYLAGEYENEQKTS